MDQRVPSNETNDCWVFFFFFCNRHPNELAELLFMYDCNGDFTVHSSI